MDRDPDRISKGGASMSMDLTAKLITGAVVLVAVIAVAWMVLTKGADLVKAAIPNKEAPAANETGTTVSGQPIVGSDVKYVNPIICALTGKFCDPNDGTADNTAVVVENVQPWDGYQAFPQTYTPGQDQGTTDPKEHLRRYYPEMYAYLYGGG